MNLAEYFLMYGEPGLVALAEACKTKVSYLRQLIYSPGVKEPSLSMATLLVKASGGKLSYERLSKLSQVDHRVLRRPHRKAEATAP